MVDDSNVKWFSTNNGLSIFLNNNWIDIPELTSAFVNKKTTRIVSDKSNNIWIGTSNGLFKYHNSSLIDYSSSLPSTKVNDLEITDNTLWVATDNGLVKYSGGTWTVYNTDNSGLSSNIVTTVCIAATGQIWIGTKAGGINRYYNEKWTHFNMNNMGLPKNVGNTIIDIASDGSGNLWVAHQAVPSGESSTTEFGGFTKFNGSSWSVIEISGIAQEQIQKLYSDNFNNIWLCSKSGLGKYSITSSSLTTFTTNNSKLPNPSVTDVIIDNNQDVWLTTDGGGVVKIKKGIIN
jgi:ligand-binding sensor domain-containing protein